MKRIGSFVKRISAVLLFAALIIASVPMEVYSSASYTAGVDWERYGNYYFYNQMSNVEREFYDALSERCLSFMIGDEKAEEYVYKNNTYYMVGYVSSDSLSIPQMVQIAKIFRYNNPQYYFLSTMIFPKSMDNSISFTTYSKFANPEDRAEANSRIKGAIRTAQNRMALAHSDADRVLYLHDYLIEMCEYEKNPSNEDTTFTQSIYSVFALDDKKTVCSGYSQAFMLLCNACNIDCICVTSDLHQWNKVRVNDIWYNIDLTWDDTGYDDDGNSTKIYSYFCRSNNAIAALDETDYHTIEDYWTDFVLPECITDSGSYRDEPGELIDPEVSVVSPGYTSTLAQGYSDTFYVSLYTATNGADIYYTTDGRTPEIGSTKSKLYTKPFKAAKNTLVRAVAVRDGYKDSNLLKMVITEETSGGVTVRLSECTVTLDRAKYKYTGDPVIPKITSVTYKDTVLSEGTDYVISSYDNNTSIGTGKIILSAVSGSNYKGSKTVTFAISPYYLSAPVVSIRNVYAGVKLSWTKLDYAKGYIIERKEEGKSYKRIAKINKKSTTAYTDKTVKANKKYYYRVTGYSKGNEYRKTYCKAIMTYRLVSPTIETLTSEKSESMKVVWKKNKRATGYQVKYVTGKTGRMFDVDKKYTAATVTGLVSQKKYQVYVRSYKKVDGKKIYSKWSKVKKVTVL